jgi:hypothetical protein
MQIGAGFKAGKIKNKIKGGGRGRPPHMIQPM